MKKSSMLNVRLDDGTASKLKQYADDHEMSKSSVVNEALAAYLRQKSTDQEPYAHGSDLFGAGNSQETDLSATYKSRLKQKMNEKHTR